MSAMDDNTPFFDQHALPPSVHDLCGPQPRLRFPHQGATSTVAIVEGERGVCVAKRAQGPQWVAWLAQEHRVLRALQATTLPIPRVFDWIDRTAAAEPEAWLIMQYLPGRTLLDALRDCDQPTERQGLLAAWGALVAKLHRTPVPAALATSAPWLARTLAQAEYNLIHYAVDGSREQLDWLRRERPAPSTPTLIHGDCMFDNMLVADGQIVGMIDWACGDVGDPRYDLALATQPEPEVFDQPDDLAAFWSGYGTPPLRAAEQHYFLTLYEFF